MIHINLITLLETGLPFQKYKFAIRFIGKTLTIYKHVKYIIFSYFSQTKRYPKVALLITCSPSFLFIGSFFFVAC